jgi:hypothetical protein
VEESVSALMDAGAPKGTPRGARIGRCAPYLYILDCHRKDEENAHFEQAAS